MLDQTPLSSPHKSTTVRFKSSPITSPAELALAGARPLLRGLSRLAPQTASQVARRMFLRPMKYRMPDREMWWATDADMFTVPFPSGKLTAWRWGWGGPKVLLVHGWAGRGLQLGAFAQPLVEAGYEVVAFDAPGHGMSYGEESSLPEMAEAVATMVRHLGGVHAVIAHSAGAAATTGILGGWGVAPDIERLVYIASPVDMVGATERFGRFVGFTRPVMQRMRHTIGQRFGIDFEMFQGLDIARRMDHPLLIVHDHNDREIAFSEGEALANAWSGAQIRSTEGLGHYRILRDPRVIRWAVDFLGPVGKGRDA